MILVFSDGLAINTSFIHAFMIEENRICIVMSNGTCYEWKYGPLNKRLNECDYNHDKNLIDQWLETYEIRGALLK